VVLGSRGLGKVGEWVGVALTMKALSSSLQSGIAV
jgi:hypothetical protein